jgi:hypothetical protein
MNGEHIGKLIQNPQSMGQDQILQIEELLEKYPYCSSLYILQLVGLSKVNDINFERKLNVAAIHVSDREYLFALVHNDQSEITEELVTQEAEEKTTSIENKKVLEESMITSVEDSITIEISEKAEIAESVDNKIDRSNTEIKIEEKEELADLDESIMSDIVEEALNSDFEETKKIKKKKEKKLESEQEIIVKRPKNLTFIQWLQYKQEVISAENIKNINKGNPKKNTVSKAMSKKEINALLDKFIDEEPSISTPSKEALNSGQKSIISPEESVDIVSETLAKIHVMQGNYAKAISAYKQLSLLYPEKKAFFASQIEKIKEKLN